MAFVFFCSIQTCCQIGKRREGKHYYIEDRLLLEKTL